MNSGANGSDQLSHEALPWWYAKIPPDLNPEVRRALIAFNKVVDNYQKDQEVIFADQSETLRRAYAADSRRVKVWRTSRKCIFSGCRRDSVPKSHTLPRVACLDVIAENGHVVTPKYKPRTGRVEVVLTGVRGASVFPGFCPEHEALFAAFERSGSMSNERDFVLQMYRAICRETVLKQFELDNIEQHRRDYLRFRDSKLKELTLAELDPEAARSVNLSGLTMKWSDWRYRMICNEIRRLKAELRFLNKDFFDPATKDARVGSSRRMSIAATSLDSKVPVALSGLGGFGWRDATGRNHRVFAVLCVMPMPNGTTYVAITGPRRHELAIESYFRHYAQDPILILNMIESWMVYGTDHWFASPSVWTTIRNDVKEALMRDYTDTSRNVAYECPHTVFNQLKRSMLARLSEIVSETEESPASVLLQGELSKLSDQRK
jgi:hypothetical protein